MRFSISFLLCRNRPLVGAIEKATKANAVFIKMKRQRKVGKLLHCYQNKSRKIIRQKNCVRLNETINTAEAEVIRQEIVQEDQTRNLKNFTMTTQDINIIVDHTEISTGNINPDHSRKKTLQRARQQVCQK